MLLLTIGLIVGILKCSAALTGVIWSQPREDFISLFEIPTFLEAKNTFLKKSRELEEHNFHKAVLRVAYYEEPNLVNFIDNDTKITGVCGDLWTIIADYLNFTLVPVNIKTRNFGLKLENGSYDGILGEIYRNESQIVPRSGVFSGRLSLLQYTIPMWTIRYHLYIKPEWEHDDVWMLHLFSINVWYAFFILLLILSIAGYVCERVSLESSKAKIRYDLQDHIFYTIAIASSQGCVPAELHNKSRIIYLFTSMFSWLILIAFSSHAIYLMMNKKFILPFKDLRGLIQKSKYDVVAFSGSMVHQNFEDAVSTFYRGMHDYSRVSYAPSAEDLYKKVCFSSKRKYAAFEAEDRHRAIGKKICRLVPTRSSYFETWIASAVKRGFRYKRSFDIGILRMFETGLLDGLKDRWLDWKVDETEEVPFQSIDISQVYLIFCLLLLGFAASILILIIEHLLYFRSKRAAAKSNDMKFHKIKMTRSSANRVFFLIK